LGVELDEIAAGVGELGDAIAQALELGRAGEFFELVEGEVVVVAEVECGEARIDEVAGEGCGEPRLAALRALGGLDLLCEAVGDHGGCSSTGLLGASR